MDYFNPYWEFRIDRLAMLTGYYEGIQGSVCFDRFELIDPKSQQEGQLAVLTFNYVSYAGESQCRWNYTEVYKRTNGQWRIVQTHWSKPQPF